MKRKGTIKRKKRKRLKKEWGKVSRGKKRGNEDGKS